MKRGILIGEGIGREGIESSKRDSRVIQTAKDCQCDKRRGGGGAGLLAATDTAACKMDIFSLLRCIFEACYMYAGDCEVRAVPLKLLGKRH